MTDRLKTCPLCDGEAEMKHQGLNWFVRCKYCFCRTSMHTTEFFARCSWNTRKPMDKIVEELETWAKSSERLYFEYNEEECYGAWRSYNKAIKIVKGEV